MDWNSIRFWSLFDSATSIVDVIMSCRRHPCQSDRYRNVPISAPTIRTPALALGPVVDMGVRRRAGPAEEHVRVSFCRMDDLAYLALVVSGLAGVGTLLNAITNARTKRLAERADQRAHAAERRAEEAHAILREKHARELDALDKDAARRQFVRKVIALMEQGGGGRGYRVPPDEEDFADWAVAEKHFDWFAPPGLGAPRVLVLRNRLR